MSKSESDVYRCHGLVLFSRRWHRCPYRGKIKVDGKWYCGIHNPREVERIKAHNRDIAQRVRRVASALDITATTDDITATTDGWSGSHQEIEAVAVVPLEDLERLAGKVDTCGVAARVTLRLGEEAP